MNRCIKCCGDMTGDGYTSVIHCEYACEQTYEYHEADADPVYCDFVEDELIIAWRIVQPSGAVVFIEHSQVREFIHDPTVESVRDKWRTNDVTPLVEATPL